MSIIQCPECKGKVSTKAEVCPHCGIPLNEKKSTEMQQIHSAAAGWKKKVTNHRIVAFILGVVTVVFLFTIIFPSGGSHEHTQRKQTTTKNSYDKAKDKANSYIDSSGFSYDGLVKQLEFEGYSSDEAKYGANASGADWEEQALKKAKSYLSMSGFSQEGLKKQLVFEGFTESEAQYAVTHCNADWEEQAYKKAKSYLSFSDMTKSELIQQLEFEGFTYQEASYGAEKAYKY